MIAFLDASALIYLVDGDAAWAQAARQELQRLAELGPALEISVSRLSVFECRVGPLCRGDQASLDRFDAFFAQPDLVWVELTAPVVELATQLKASHGLRTPVPSCRQPAACSLEPAR